MTYFFVLQGGNLLVEEFDSDEAAEQFFNENDDIISYKKGEKP